MGSYTKITADAFEKLQYDAGIICSKFNPEAPAPPDDEDILFATTGNITFSAVPTFIDDGEDVNGCPNNTMELKRRSYSEVKLSGTSLSFDADALALMAGSADKDGNKVTPKRKLSKEDFRDIWWVGDYGDNDSGFVAILIKNALSTGGTSLSFGKEAKGQSSFEFTGHYSLENQDEEPYVFYINKGSV